MSKKLLILICLAALICSGCIGNNEESSGVNQGAGQSENPGANDSASVSSVEDETSDEAAEAGNPYLGSGSSEPAMSVAITSPKTGSVLSGDGTVSFSSEVKGGKEPYSYSWSSSLGDKFPSEGSFDQEISELGSGEHTVILKVTDAAGESAQSTTSFRVI
jgi:hypothetical protein